MSSNAELKDGFGPEENKEFIKWHLTQCLIEADDRLKSNYPNGHSVGDWFFSQLEVSQNDRGLYIRMMEALDVALNWGRGKIESLNLKIVDGDRPCLIYSEEGLAVPIMVGQERTDINLRYWVCLPSFLDHNRKYIYNIGEMGKVGERGVDGLLEHLGLGCFAKPEKFGVIENWRHAWEKLQLGEMTQIRWIEGDRRSFIIKEKLGDGSIKTTYYFHLDGGFWGSKLISVEEAKKLGQSNGRKVDPKLFRRGE